MLLFSVFHQRYERVEIIFAFADNAVEPLAACLRAFYVAEDTFFESRKESFGL